MKKPISGKIVAAFVAMMLFIAVNAFFLTHVPLPPEAGIFSPVFGLLLMAPTLWAARWWLGWRDAIVLFAMLGLFALVMETCAIMTGFPYGHFQYSDLLGYKLFGRVPWMVFFSWTPLVIGAYPVADRIFRFAALRIAATALLLLAFDVVLDPGAVKLGFWQYHEVGFYGVPITNFAGWLFSGSIGALLIDLFTRIRKPLLPAPAQLVSGAFFIVALWTGVAIFSGMIAPAFVGVIVLVFLGVFYFHFYYAFDDMIVYVDEQNNALSVAPKLAAHNSDTKLHRAFSVFIFSRRGELLLQQRALSKKTWPGVWSNSVCGHVMLHESVEAAAKRRLKYELGISGVDLKVLLPDFRYRAEKDGVVENEICPVLVGVTEREPRANPLEVNETRWVDWSDFIVEVADPSNGYSPWAREEVELLAKHPAINDILL